LGYVSVGEEGIVLMKDRCTHKAGYHHFIKLLIAFKAWTDEGSVPATLLNLEFKELSHAVSAVQVATPQADHLIHGVCVEAARAIVLTCCQLAER